MAVLTALVVGMMFALGVFQLLRRDLIKAAMGFAILYTAVNLFLIAVSAYQGEVPAYIDPPEKTGAETSESAPAARQPSDPLVQALILTAIVVSFGSYALLLGMVNIASRRYETIDSDELNQLTG